MMSSQQYGQVAAPSNMMFPTAAYLQAAQNAADMQMRGMESLSKGLAGGINTAIAEYTKYKDMKSQVGASEKSYNTLKSFLPPEIQSKFDSEIESLNQNPNASLRDKAAFWDQAKNFIGSSVGQAFQMQKQKAELDARAGLQAASDIAARDRAVLGGQTQFDIEQLRQKYRAQQGGGVNFSIDPIGGAGGGANYYNQQYGD